MASTPNLQLPTPDTRGPTATGGTARLGVGVWALGIAIGALLFVMTPRMIALAPYESTMGLVQKIFYYHAPSGITMFLSAFVAGIAGLLYIFKRQPRYDRMCLAASELTVLFGAMVLITGPLWARKAWGVWWDWDARLTSSLLLWMMFVACLLVRRYGGPGGERLGAAIAAFGMVNVPFVYVSVNIWRTLHPKTTVVPSLAPGMRGVFWICTLGFVVLYTLLLTTRARLERQRAMAEDLHLALEERSTHS
jgi:heme exporter protein C